MNNKIILSLFDLTGIWSRPYKENGYKIIQVDLQLGIDILTWDYKKNTKRTSIWNFSSMPLHGFCVIWSKTFCKKR